VNPFVRVPLPPGVVTTTFTAPAGLCGGATALIWVLELTVKLSAAVPAKVTAVAPVKFVPVISVGVPPARGPDVGLIDVTVGVAKYVNWSLADVADVPAPLTGDGPAEFVTRTSTVAAEVRAGDVAVIVVALTMTTLVAAVPPKLTVEPVMNCVPVIVTFVPPPVGPLLGLTAVTVGVVAL